MICIHLVSPRNVRVQGRRAPGDEEDPLESLAVCREPVLAGKGSVVVSLLSRVRQPGRIEFPLSLGGTGHVVPEVPPG